MDFIKTKCKHENTPETSSIFSNNPLVSFRHSKNVRQTLVHSSLPQELSSPCGTFPCGVSQYKTCKFIDSSTTISSPKFVYHIKHHFTCTSSHLIYCISCSRCGMLYIGETGRSLRTRFGEHRHAVTSKDANQPVARHFNNGSPCVSDMKIRALCPISGSNDSRKRHEMRLISKLGIVHPLGINERLVTFNGHLSLSDTLPIDSPSFLFLPHFVLCVSLPGIILCNTIYIFLFKLCFDEIHLIGFYFVT